MLRGQTAPVHALTLAIALCAAPAVIAQPAPLDRLPTDMLDMTPPSARVTGAPGHIAVTATGCRSAPRDALRRRIVDIAIQEWGYHGFTVVDETTAEFASARIPSADERRRRGVDPIEAARVAQSIAGYWSVTADGAWIIDRQNRIWQTAGGVGRRWRDPWSAAFISWVMCEAGLAESAEFRRHVAHYAYIDQAIEARDGRAPAAAFKAYEVGERPVAPGDLLCRARRGAYKTLDERRADIGDGARSHCDVVVRLEPEHERILVIGGNVRGSVRLKFLPAVAAAASAPPGRYRSIGRGDRVVFAHLQLDAPAIAEDAFATSPTLEALAREPAALAALERRLAAPSQHRDVSRAEPAG